MTVDLVIRGGTLLTPRGRMAGGLAVDGGVIVAVAADDALPGGREVVDARGRQVLPGIIDSHVHFREPGLEYKEDWSSGTAAAAGGGVTTVLEMPKTRPPTATVEALGLEQRCAARGARVDYGIYGLLAQDNADALEGLAAHGLIGFKCYMGETVGAIPAPDEREGEIHGADLHSKSRITPFEGVKTRGRPVCTIVRGRVVMRDGALVGEPDWGRPVVPARAVAVA